MPGRLFLTASLAEVAAAFGAEAAGTEDPGSRPELAPGDHVWAVVAQGGRRIVAMRWGMIPMGRVNARGRPVLETLVNARSETLFTKSAFDGLGRAIVPVTGWYEWTGKGRRKARWAISGEGMLAFAAVWDRWRAPGGADVLSLATVTCAPNAEVAAVHDRMPAILAAADWPVWLGEADGDPSAALQPLADGRLRVAPA